MRTLVARKAREGSAETHPVKIEHRAAPFIPSCPAVRGCVGDLIRSDTHHIIRCRRPTTIPEFRSWHTALDTLFLFVQHPTNPTEIRALNRGFVGECRGSRHPSKSSGPSSPKKKKRKTKENRGIDGVDSAKTRSPFAHIQK